MKYTFCYFDVSGDETNGYEVVNWEILFDDWYIADDCTNQDIINYLYDNGYLATNSPDKLYIKDFGMDKVIYATQNNFPLFGIMYIVF